MSDFRIFAEQFNVGRSVDGWRAARGLRDGSLVTVPWYQALVFEGRCFGMHGGSVTTPMAGHAAIDADQPEGSIYIATTGVSLIPLYIMMAMETGATTLAQGGMMAAISNINVGAGTSTAFTPFNLKMTTVGYTPSASAAVTYTGNGTDPLTAGNFLEIARASAVIDADAATSGIIPPVLKWAAGDALLAPMVEDIGSILAYGEAAANTLYLTMFWAELPSTAFS
mgnify:FL=1